MAHSVIIINNSLLHIFDPNDPEYDGTRDHYTSWELEKIDELRNRAHPTSYTLTERIFIMAVIDKAILLAENET